MYSSSKFKLLPESNYLFGKEVVLNQKQFNAIKSGTIVDCLRTGVDLQVAQNLRSHKNFALIKND